jgi:hypothetical protein
MHVLQTHPRSVHAELVTRGSSLVLHLISQAFHGEKELFLSDHFDKCSVKTVMAKCRVLSLSRYQELAHIEENDFFARFTYRVRLLPVCCIWFWLMDGLKYASSHAERF